MYVHSLDSLPHPTAQGTVMDRLKLSLYLYLFYFVLFFRLYSPPRVGKCFVWTHKPVDNCSQNVGNVNAGTPSSSPHHLTSRDCQPPAPCCWQNWVPRRGLVPSVRKGITNRPIPGNIASVSFSTFTSQSLSDRLWDPHDRGDSASPSSWQGWTERSDVMDCWILL